MFECKHIVGFDKRKNKPINVGQIALEQQAAQLKSEDQPR